MAVWVLLLHFSAQPGKLAIGGLTEPDSLTRNIPSIQVGLNPLKPNALVQMQVYMWKSFSLCSAAVPVRG